MKKFMVLFYIFVMSMLLSSCVNTKLVKKLIQEQYAGTDNGSVKTDNSQMTDDIESEKDFPIEESSETEVDPLYAYIEKNYGFADKLVYGTYTSSTIREGNVTKIDKESMKFIEGSKGGAVFYKALSDEKAVCIYLSEYDRMIPQKDGTDKNEVISIKADCINERYSTHTVRLSTPHMKSRCYCTVQENYLIVVELAEDSAGWCDGHYYLSRDVELLPGTSDDLQYEEKISVYDLNNNMERKCEITREIQSCDGREYKKCEIKEGDAIWAYASGFNSYTYEAAVLFETEQEFCDKANHVLSGYSVTDIYVESFLYNLK